MPFHINPKGNPGECDAEPGECPFGNNTPHYPTEEEAREAYEKQNSNFNNRSLTKKKRNEFNPNDWSGFQKDQLEYDQEEIYKKMRNSPKFSSINNETLKKIVEDNKKNWENLARTDPAQSYEKNVPARLIPEGTPIWDSKNEQWTEMGSPVNSGKDKFGKTIVDARYKTDTGWENALPNKGFNVGEVDAHAKPSSKFKRDNEKAALLAEQRKLWENHKNKSRMVASREDVKVTTFENKENNSRFVGQTEDIKITTF